MNLVTRELAFLDLKKGQLKPDTQQEYASRMLKTVDSVKTLKFDISGASNIVELLTANTIQKRGISDWDGNKLPARENFVFSSLSIGFAVVPDGTSAGAVSYARKVTSFPVALQNANIVIKQEGQPPVSIPIYAITKESDSDKPNLDTWYQLKNMVILKEQEITSIELHFPEGASVPNDAHYSVSVDLGGIKTTIR